MASNTQDQLEDSIEDMFKFIFGLMQSYQEHKDKQLLEKIQSASKVPDFNPKQCNSRGIDPFEKIDCLDKTLPHQWKTQTSFYQPYYPIKQNVHFQWTMDWMELARPGSFAKAPDPMKFNHQDRYYPKNFEDEKHTKLRLLINFGEETYGYNQNFLHCVSAVLDLPEKLVINYFLMTIKDKRESQLGKESGNAKQATQHAEAVMARYVNIFGPEISKLMSLEDVVQIETSQPTNRSFLLTQYYCPHCEYFFCPDHINCDYEPVFYFQFDETEYSELKSNFFLNKKKTHAELDKIFRTEPLTIYHGISCVTNPEKCWKSKDVTEAETIAKGIKLSGVNFERIKNFLKVCINSNTTNTCFLDYLIDELACFEIGALMVNIYKEDFRNAAPHVGPTRSSNNNKKGALDRKKVQTKLEMDKSQFPGFFGDEFAFSIHPHNLLIQKNRVIIGDSGICPGLGLFAGQRFFKDQLVCLYFGEILEEDETSNYRAKINNLYDTSYVFSLSEGRTFSIDSLIFGNKSRFVNHNEGNLNNCTIELAEMNKMEYILFKAKKDIDFGEELFFDYGDSYTLHWKYIYKHLFHFMHRLNDKRKASQKVKNRVRQSLQQRIDVQ